MSDIYKLSKPFFYIAKFFGLACYTVDTKTKVLRTSRFDILLFVATMVIWFTSLWIQLARKTLIDTTNLESLILGTFWFHQLNIHHYLALLLVTFNFTQRRTVRNLLKTLNDFDRKFGKLGWVSKSQEMLFIVAVVIFFSYLLIVVVYNIGFVLKYNWFERMPAATVAFYTTNYCLVVFFYFVVSQQFIVCAFCVRGRLISLRYNLR